MARTKPANRRFPKWAYAVLVISLCVVSRLPQLLSPSLFLDGDECILGLMAKHTAEAKEIPLYLLGQNYGLASIEAGAGALSFLLLGVGAVPLKIAMLALWGAGVVFFFLAFAALLGDAGGFLASALLIFLPAWASHSMKAWGGYVTAFTCSAIIIYLIVRFKDRPRNGVSLLLGGLTSLVFLAQPLWLPALLPFVLFYFLSRRMVVRFIFWFLGIAGVACFVKLISLAKPPAIWTHPPFVLDRGIFGALLALPERVYAHLTGSYYLWGPAASGPATKLAAFFWAVLIFGAVFVQIYRLVKKEHNSWSLLFFLSMLLTLPGAVLPTPDWGPRYLLPLSGFLAGWVAIEISDGMRRGRGWRRAASAVLVLLILSGAGSMIEFGNQTSTAWRPSAGPTEVERMNALIEYLKSHAVRNVFSMHSMLQWQVIFYSREEILARWQSDRERYPPYIDGINTAYRNGEKTALLGYSPQADLVRRLVDDPKSVVRVADGYFVFLNPSENMLRKLGFTLR